MAAHEEDRSADLEVVRRVRTACVEADGHDPLDEAASLALEHRGLAGASLWVEDAPDGGGFALVRGDDLVLAVAPDARGRGVGGRLLDRAVDAAGPVLAWSHGDHPAAAALATRGGWRRVRDLWVMRRAVAVPLPEVEVPDGVEVRGFRDGDASDAEQVLAVNAAAFASHPEQGDLDAEGLAERMAEPWWDPAGLVMAVDADDRLLAFHWTKQHDADHGEVYVVGVSPAAQGRGLGRVVTLAGLHHLAGLGVAEVLLYVESDNTAAVHLYSGLGFTHARRDTHAQYAR
ncbi:mycothiol synthase [Nocardioides litoris]|uniref:mycothiol synthase n=1 Tax=Nocardioides litoris TaxID=1926648 RepID=UPI0011233FBA|nr:mycothiol synthase [Nocardioides litoris]